MAGAVRQQGGTERPHDERKGRQSRRLVPRDAARCTKQSASKAAGTMRLQPCGSMHAAAAGQRAHACGRLCCQAPHSGRMNGVLVKSHSTPHTRCFCAHKPVLHIWHVAPRNHSRQRLKHPSGSAVKEGGPLVAVQYMGSIQHYITHDVCGALSHDAMGLHHSITASTASIHPYIDPSIHPSTASGCRQVGSPPRAVHGHQGSAATGARTCRLRAPESPRGLRKQQALGHARALAVCSSTWPQRTRAAWCTGLFQ